MSFALKVLFADGVSATVNAINQESNYKGLIQATPGSLSRLVSHFHERIAGKMARGRGRYILEPELMNEVELWGDRIMENMRKHCGKCLKQYLMTVHLQVDVEGGYYTVKLEWYQSIEELASTPLLDLVKKAVSSVSWTDVKPYSKFTIFSWENL
jgi:hypothetical protein